MKNPHDTQYLDLVSEVFHRGTPKNDRTETGTWSLFGQTLTFDLQRGFPLVTVKQTPFRWIAEELLWFVRGGDANGDLWEQDLANKGVSIWRPWAGPDGNLGPIYGSLWRAWPVRGPGSPADKDIDQLKAIEHKLVHHPDDRRMLVSAWHPEHMDRMALPPCHYAFQFYSEPTDLGRYLHLMVQQRSCDLFLGVPFNIASYGLLNHLMAHATGHRPGTLTWVGGDCHVYRDQAEAVRTLLTRNPLAPPTLFIEAPPRAIEAYRYKDLKLVDYHPHGKIAAPVAV